MADAAATRNKAPFEVAVIGAGLVGLHVCLGLLRRNIPVVVYEQASALREIGAGLGLSTTLEDTIKAIDPAAWDVLQRVSAKGEHPGFVNGLSSEDHTKRSIDSVYDFELPPKTHGSYYCQRSQLLEELVKLVPEGVIHLKKRVEKIVQSEETGKITIEFTDGTTTETDAVIGADGVKSHVRRAIAESGTPTGEAHYSHESAYRFLVPMDKIRPLWGDLALRPIVWIGNGAHMACYPVANNTQLNVAAFLLDDKEWPTPEKHVIEAGKTEMVDSCSDFCSALQTLIKIAPEQHTRWGLFDTFDQPLLTYASGAVVLAGDSAHASLPHHGLGAGMGVEDALFLVTLLDEVSRHYSSGSGTASAPPLRLALTEAFQIYDGARKARTQEVVASSRRQGQITKGQIISADDHEALRADITRRLDSIYRYNAMEENDKAAAALRGKLGARL